MKNRNEFEKLLRAYFLSMLLLVCATAAAAGIMAARSSTESIMLGSEADSAMVGASVSEAASATDKLYTLTVGEKSFTVNGSSLRRVSELMTFAPAPVGNLWRLAGDIAKFRF